MVNSGSENGANDSGEPRGRGILTPADRVFLSMSDADREENYSAPGRSQRRRAVAERIENALLDFPTLTREVDDETVRDVFAPEREGREVDGETVAGTEIQSGQIGVPFGIAFLLRVRLAGDLHQPNPRFGVEQAIDPFLDDVEDGIEIWMNEQHGLIGDVDVSVSVDGLQAADDLADEVRDLDEPLTGRERIETVSQLGRAGYDADEILAIVGEE